MKSDNVLNPTDNTDKVSNRWRLQYREPICGGNRAVEVYGDTLMDALTIFNNTDKTSGFDTPIRATLLCNHDGCTSHENFVFTLQGRYGIPRRV